MTELAGQSGGRVTALPIGLRLLALGLVVLWAAAGVLVFLAYHPGGPVDLLVRVALFAPLPVAVAAFVWPPRGRTWRENAALTWLGLISGLLLVPLLGGVLETMRSTARQPLFPSGEVAYAGLLALGSTCLFAGLGLIRRRLGERYETAKLTREVAPLA